MTKERFCIHCSFMAKGGEESEAYCQSPQVREPVYGRFVDCVDANTIAHPCQHFEEAEK